jgi:hypothetical protein
LWSGSPGAPESALGIWVANQREDLRIIMKMLPERKKLLGENRLRLEGLRAFLIIAANLQKPSSRRNLLFQGLDPVMPNCLDCGL